MDFISKIKDFYFRMRLEHCFKQYSKYLNFLELGKSFFIHSDDYYSYQRHRNHYIKLFDKYKQKCLVLYKKLNISPPESFL